MNPNTALKIVIKSQESKTKEKGKKTYKDKSKTINKIAVKTYILIITLNVNGLNAPTKTHRLAKRIQKQDLCTCCLQANQFRYRDSYRLKVGEWKKLFHANGKQHKVGEAKLISDKIDFKIKTVTRDK